MLMPLFVILGVLTFALPVVAVRPVTPLRAGSTVAAVLVGFYIVGELWELEGALVYVCVVPLASIFWIWNKAENN